MVEIDTAEQIEVKDSGVAVAYVTNNVEVEKATDLDIRVAKKEYNIVGDDVYVPRLYEEAPQWMKDLVQLVVDNAILTSNTATLAQLASILSEFATSYVPLNQYTQSILDLSTEDTRLLGVIETLNANLSNGINEANAQIIDLQLTKVSTSEALALVVDTLAAELNTPTSNLGATIASLQQSIANESSARTVSMDAMESTLETLDGNISANAAATTSILTYVGIDEAGASTNTGLSAYLESSDGTIGGANSQVANNVVVTGGVATSKWQYNSAISVNGVNYNSGFGLSNSTGTGIGSEFWIDATKLKFTNSTKTGRSAPFTIDASGLTPKITFNGVVDFTGTNTNGTTTLDGDNITTGTLTATQVQTGSLSADRFSPSSGASTVWSGGGLVSENFNGNPAGNIGTPTTGFRLSSNAAGTASDPNVYGAYIKGGIIEGSYVKYGSNYLLTDSGNLAPYFITGSLNFNGNTTAYTGTFSRLYSPSYSSGYISTRLSRYTQKVLIFGGMAGDSDLVTLTVEYAYDGGAWNTLYTGSVYMDYRHSLSMSTEVTLRSTPYNYVDFRVVVSGSVLQTLGMTLLSNNI